MAAMPELEQEMSTYTPPGESFSSSKSGNDPSFGNEKVVAFIGQGVEFM
jgi:hypothetical protein